MATRSKPSALIRINVDEKGAIAGLKRTVTAFSKSALRINQSLEVLGKVWGAVTGAIGAVVGATKEWIALAQEQTRSELDLKNALSLRGANVDKVFASTQQLNGALQQSGIAGDEFLLQQQKKLLLMGIEADALGDATKAVVGLAEVTGNLESATKLAGRALTGDVAALKRYGIVAKDAADAQDKLNGFFETALARSQTLERRTNALAFNYGDLKEKLGFTIERSSAFNAIVETVSGTVASLTNFLKTEGGIRAVEEFGKAIAGVAAAGLTTVLALARIPNKIREISVSLGLLDFHAESLAPGSGGLTDIITELRNKLEGISTGSVSATVATDATVLPSGGGGGGGGGKGGKRRRVTDTSGATSGVAGDADGPVAALEAQNAAFLAGLQQEEQAMNARAAIRDRWEKDTEARFQRQESLEKEATAATKEQADERARIAAKQAKEQGAASEQLLGALAGQTQGVISNGIAMAAAAAVSGENVLASFGKMIGGTIQSIGQLLIQMGTGGILAGTLGTVIPAFAALTGGPLGVAAGTAAVVGGTAMVALGAALGGGGASAKAKPATGARGAGAPASASGVPQGFKGTGAPESITRIQNITFSGLVFGSQAELGRAVKRATAAADRLAGAPRQQIAMAGGGM